MSDSKRCEHREFASQVIVTRITRTDDDPTVIGYKADVQVRCKDCSEPFQFVGRPATSPDGLELRLSIRPIYDQTQASRES